jgi:DMSO/TMAO reductase YedYZ molybdopterin-dependent catalytic subunit
VTTPFSRLGAKKRSAGQAGDRLPPGQYLPRGWPVLHYGKVPTFVEAAWDFKVFGATAGGEQQWDWAQFGQLPRTDVGADFHCVTKFSLLDNTWTGVSTATVTELAPPAPEATHVMVWAEYGYSANMSLADFTSPDALFVTHRDGELLTPEHGFPLRLVVPKLYFWKSAKWVRGFQFIDRNQPGFWETYGYHLHGDPWTEERHS